MRFVRKNADTSKTVDSVFSVVKLAKDKAREIGEENVYNATIGSLYNEDDMIVAFDTVYQSFAEIPKEDKAAYASAVLGNSDYLETVYKWVFQKQQLNLYHREIATPGGTGAIALAFKDILDKGDTVLLPDIAWSSYIGMANENELQFISYQLFDGDKFNLTSFKECCETIMQKQDRLLIIINDPCHNPTGYSLSTAEWQEIITYLNKCAEKHAVFLLNDIAYIDYSYSPNYGRDYMSVFNDIENNFVVYITFSCSKSLTSYGMRCGAGILLGKVEKNIQDILEVFTKSSRAFWSNVNNAAMENFVLIIDKYRDAYLSEKAGYVELLKERSSLFIREAQECGLPIYPYKEGFFITVRVADRLERENYHQRLLENNIFTVQVNKGIRVAICSLPLPKIKGLAAKMQALLP